MNQLERYMAVLRGEPVDFLPRLPILMQFAAEYIGSNYGEFASDHRVLVEANLRCAEDFGFEQISAISDPYRETQGFGAEIVYVADGVPRCPNPPLADAKDLSVLERPDPLRSERMRDRIEALRAFRERAGGRYSVLGWIEGPAAEAADLRGVTAFLMDLMTDEPFAAELMDLCTEVGVEFARAQLGAGAETIGIGDAIASQVSPAVYERLIRPRERRMTEAIHDAGGLVRLHICGDVTHLLPGIAGLGADIVDADHMVDLRSMREALGGGTVLAGNIDPAAGVKAGSPEAIRAHVRETYAAVGNPFMVTAGCEVPSGTPPENLKALCTPVPYAP
jgi:MtaA/CmuA family methyltransferase